MKNLSELTDEELVGRDVRFYDAEAAVEELQARLRQRLGSGGAGDPSIARSLEWVRREQAAYSKAAGGKYADAREEESRLEDLAARAERIGAGSALVADAGWWVRLSLYASRALTLGATTPNGLQALGKLASTAVALHAAALRLADREGGWVPEPGRPSGELARWDG